MAETTPSSGMNFREEHLRLFAEISRDTNPLHLERDYARRTPFGDLVVYGVAVMLSALGVWARGRPFRLKTLDAQFRKPVFLDREYEVQVKRLAAGDELLVVRNNTVYCRVSFTWEPSELVPGSRYPAELSKLHLMPGQLPDGQLAALLWSSYQVGMVTPGKQALFTELKIEFGRSDGAGGEFSPKVSVQEQAKFNQVRITGSGDGVTKLTLTAFRRPEAVSFSPEEVRAEAGSSDRFTGKKALITGSSRGFGAVLATVMALHGADVILNGRRDSEELRRLQDEIAKATGRRPPVCVMDLAAGDGTKLEMLAKMDFGGLDILVNNASPPIVPDPFLDQTAEEFLGYVHACLSLVVGPTRAALPLLPKGGLVLNISSVYAETPPSQFSHYVTAKSAIEGLSRGLAAEWKDVQFVIARLPRILTDQTNLHFDSSPPRSPVSVAVQLIERLGSPGEGNFHYLELP